MTIDNKKAARLGTGTASNNTIDKPHSTKADPLLGWFNLAKPSRAPQPKKSWKRGKQRGRIDAFLAAQLALLIVLVVLTVGGVRV